MPNDAVNAPSIVGIGGSNRAGSSTDRLLAYALEQAEGLGARTALFTGERLAALPLYGTMDPSDDAVIEAVRECDGLIISTPSYHGGMSGLLKNALDHLEALRSDARPYLDGRAVGLIVTAGGWQAGGTALVSLRSTVHALRGWPTPFAAALNSAQALFEPDGTPAAPVADALTMVATQVVHFAQWHHRAG